jgi:serine/threonine protein kinase
MDSGNIDMKFIISLIPKYKPNLIPADDIKLIKSIGEGAEGKVYLAEYNSQKVAVKVITDLDKKCFEQELSILTKVSHKNIPKFRGLVSDKCCALVMDFIQGGTLADLDLKTVSEKNKIAIIKQLAEVLEYLHFNKLIHRDLKPENIMLDVGCNLYLIDFGISKVINECSYETTTRAKGTMLYLAPESLDCVGYSDEEDIMSVITTQVDVWGYGCIVSYLFSGFLPWTNKYKEEFVQNELIQKTKFPVPENLDNDVICKIVTICTEISPDARSSIKQVKDYLIKLK